MNTPEAVNNTGFLPNMSLSFPQEGKKAADINRYLTNDYQSAIVPEIRPKLHKLARRILRTNCATYAEPIQEYPLAESKFPAIAGSAVVKIL
jgi:hypothetical protein